MAVVTKLETTVSVDSTEDSKDLLYCGTLIIDADGKLLQGQAVLTGGTFEKPLRLTLDQLNSLGDVIQHMRQEVTDRTITNS